MEVDEESLEDLPILPEKVWHKIFEFLSYEELKSSTLVSKSWNVLISNYSRFIFHTRLCKEGITKDCWSILKSSHKSYRCVTMSFIATKYLSMTIPMWTNLTHLELYECTVVGSKFLILLRQLPVIAALMLHRMKIVKRNSICDPIKLKLTDLLLEHKNDSTDWIFDHLQCTEVSNYIKLWGSWARKSDSIIKFLNRLKGHINFLHIVRIDLDYTEIKITPEFNFKWRQLGIDTYENKDMIISEQSLNTKKLCEASSMNSALKLSTIEDESHDQNAIQILKFCVSANMESFEFAGELYGGSSDFTAIGIFDSIENLKLRCYQSHDINPVIDPSFFSMFPNITNLSLEDITVDYFNQLAMDIISSELKFVKKIKIELNDSHSENDNFNIMLEHIKFPELESITLGPLAIFANHPQKTCEKMKKFLEFHKKLKSITFIEKKSINDQLKYDKFLRMITENIKSSQVCSINVARVQKINFTNFKWDDDGPSREIPKTIASKSTDTSME